MRDLWAGVATDDDDAAAAEDWSGTYVDRFDASVAPHGVVVVRVVVAASGG